MQYRHEWKHEISYADLLTLRSRLSAVMKPDSHAENGSYLVRSLYFDNAADKALREKTDGVNVREKFRVRYYNGDLTTLHLEKKSKRGGLGCKDSAPLTADQAQSIVDGTADWMKNCGVPLLEELYTKMQTQGLAPKTIVDYQREPYVFAPGNVRVTLDYHIRTGLQCTDFLNPDCVTIPVKNETIILEVKWDNFLPSLIRDVVQLPNCRTEAYSKYAACRVYG